MQSERRNSGLSKEELISNVGSCVQDNITNGTYLFKIKKLGKIYLNNQSKDSIEYLCQDIILRKLYNNIKHLYNIEQSNRNLIVRQMVSLLTEDTTKWVVRLDIRHFYESINRNSLIEQFQEDGKLNYQSIGLLKNLIKNPIISIENGLPRGLSICSVMSEIYMKYFDYEIRRIDGVFYYARFVDDIIVFCSNKLSQEEVWTQIPKLLSKIGLSLI